MIITLIFVIMLVLGIIFECKGNYDITDFGAVLIVLSSIVLSVLFIVIIGTHATAEPYEENGGENA